MMNPTTDSFSDWLRQRRSYAGLTREALAERAAVSPDAIYAIESRQRGPSLDMFIRLCTALSYPPERVLRIIAPLREISLEEASQE
jgi:transcriptional regulator with XRE-family HTH domain